MSNDYSKPGLYVARIIERLGGAVIVDIDGKPGVLLEDYLQRLEFEKREKLPRADLDGLSNAELLHLLDDLYEKIVDRQEHELFAFAGDEEPPNYSRLVVETLVEIRDALRDIKAQLAMRT